MVDLRVQKTQLAIKKAFVDLVLAEGFQNVTVSALAKKAMINRQTFYKHYTDKYDLARQFTTEILDWYDGLGAQRIDLAQKGYKVADVIDRLRPTLNQLAQQYGDAIKALRQVDIPDVDIQNELKKRIISVAGNVIGDPLNDFEKVMLGAIFTGLIDYMIDHNGLASTEEVMASLRRLQHLFE